MTSVAPVAISHKTDFLQEFGELFRDIQLSGIFSDSITFNDCVPKAPANEILSKYRIERDLPGFDLAVFLLDNFNLPDFNPQFYETNPESTIDEHIDSLWTVLTREHRCESGSSLIPLPHRYIVPGGRFRGLYYWDTYFTMLGLEESGRFDLIENMLDNFAFLIDEFGFIPNANRTYYLGRSQPPVFALMIEILARQRGEEVWQQYLPFLEKEYAFWMNGHQEVSEHHPAEGRVVRLQNGTLMNRYWDNFNAPRPESFKEDVEVGQISGRSLKEVFRHIRAGAESGWDFSSRWFKNGLEMQHIHTTDILPIDLNCLILNIEKMLLQHSTPHSDDPEKSAVIAERARARETALRTLFWNEHEQFFMDFDWTEGRQTPVLSLAGAYPLFFNIATKHQADATADVLKDRFLKIGGFVTSLTESGQQWDLPNGWAPLQWIVFSGLWNYQHHNLAREGAGRWLKANRLVYRNTGKMTEKYNLLDRLEDAQGGEYPNQDGFGWTNGVYVKLTRLLPDL